MTSSGVKNFLEKYEQTLSTAESLTGGAIASEFVSISGVSSLFRGGVVAYQEEVKEVMLEVPRCVISKHGVVSEEVAYKMAEGIKTVMFSDWAISTTGVAGPTGGTEKCPVGMVCFGIALPNGKVHTHTHCWRPDLIVGRYGRAAIRNASVEKAYELLLEQMKLWEDKK